MAPTRDPSPEDQSFTPIRRRLIITVIILFVLLKQSNYFLFLTFIVYGFDEMIYMRWKVQKLEEKRKVPPPNFSL